MKPLPVETREIKGSGVKEVIKFSVQVNNKAFNLLSSGMYSNQIKAIVRELSTNAYDSHVSVNNEDLPFFVHLPTFLVKEFRIRDYGAGMSKEQIEKIYSTFFCSDKEDSNEMNGMLGLGSKSPLGYTDNMTISSYRDGRKLMYSIYMDEDGVPCLANMGTFNTDESNGFEVTIPTKDDHEKWEAEALEVYRWFPIIPKTNIKDFEKKIEDHRGKATYTFDDGVIYESEIGNYRSGGSLSVVMGNVCYPVDVRKLNSNFHTVFMHSASPVSIVLNMAIGSVSFMPSREALTYNDHTIENVEAALDMVLLEYVDGLYEKAKEIDNFFTYKNFYNSTFVRHTALSSYYVNTVIGSSKFHSERNKFLKLMDKFDMSAYTNVKKPTVPSEFIVREVVVDTAKSISHRTALVFNGASITNTINNYGTSGNVLGIHSLLDVGVIFNNTGRAITTLVRMDHSKNASNTLNSDTTIVPKNTLWIIVNLAKTKKNNNKEVIAEFKKTFKYVTHFLNTDDLNIKVPERVVREKSDDTLFNVAKLRKSLKNHYDMIWEKNIPVNDFIEKTDPVYYIVDGLTKHSEGKLMNAYEYMDKYNNSIDHTGYRWGNSKVAVNTKKDLIRIPKRHAKFVKGKKNLIDFEKVVDKFTKMELSKRDVNTLLLSSKSSAIDKTAYGLTDFLQYTHDLGLVDTIECEEIRELDIEPVRTNRITEKMNFLNKMRRLFDKKEIPCYTYEDDGTIAEIYESVPCFYTLLDGMSRYESDESKRKKVVGIIKIMNHFIN
jgi:hypothetical protein